MASKKKGGRNDFDFDSDLDFDIPDFGGDNPEAVKKDRKPIATGMKSAAAGFGKTFANEARLRKTLTKSLPKEYEEPISKAFEIKDGARDLYNTTATQAGEILRETKRSVGRIARNLDSALPKKLSDKLKAWGDSADSDSSGSMSKSEIEQGTIDSAFASIFAQTQQAQADNQKKQDAKAIIQDQIDTKRHKDMTQILGSIDNSLLSLTTFQDKISTNYMKKSLELQFRSYFVQNDMLQLQVKFFDQFKTDLQAITKNTGLPDYVKKAPKEALMELMRQKTFDSLASTLSRKRSQWMSGVFKKAGKKVTDVLGNVREGLSTVLDTAESGTSMYGSGMGPSGAEMAGDLVGGFAGGKAQDAIAKRIRAAMLKNPKAVKHGNKLAQVFGGLPQWVGNELENGKYADKIPEWLKEILKPEGESSSVNLSREVDLDRAARWSEKSARSLNIVIPDLLSKIHHELYVSRTGDVKSKPLAYDYEKGKFVQNKDRQSQLADTIVSGKTKEATKHQIDSIFKEIDPEGTKIHPKARQAIAERIYGANKDNVYFNRENMLSHRVIGDHDGAREAIQEYIEKDPSGANERRLSRMFGNVGAHNGEVKDVVQSLIDQGRHGELADMGILDLKTGRINMDMIRKMELGHGFGGGNKTPNRPQTHTGQGIEGGGAAGEDTIFSAFGNIFSGGNVKAFAKGGVFSNKVVNRPTAFPMKNGKTGVMGEAGPEAIMPLSRDEKGRLGVKVAKGKTEKVVEEIRDILKRFEAKGFGGGMMDPEMLEAYLSGKVQDAKGFFGRGGALARKGVFGAGKALWTGAKNSFDRTKRMGKTLTGWATSGGSSALDWLGKQKDKFDLYIGNEVEPRLSRAKLEAGKYIDEATGKVIEKYEDIKGNVKDIDTGEIVLRASELKDGILKNFETGKSVLLRLTGWGKSAIKTSMDRLKKTIATATGFSKSVYGLAWTGVKKAYEQLTDAPQDVYLKDQYETPVLLKRIMEQGLYFDKATLDPITKVSQIKGPVVDNEENVLITKEDLARGLYDKEGKEIKTGFDKIAQFVGNSIKGTLATYKKILGKGKDLGMKAMGWLKGLFGFDSPFTVFSSRTNDILTAMYAMLNDRLPGERSPELDSMIGKSGSGSTGQTVKKAGKAATAFKQGFMSRWRKGKDQAQGKLDELKERLPGDIDRAKHMAREAHRDASDKVNEWKDEHWDPAEQAVREKLGRGKDRVVDGLHAVVDTLRERLPDKKAKLEGDSDGDGVRDGSIDDIRKKRAAAKAEKEKEKEEAEKTAEKGSSKGAFAALASFFKKKKGEDDEKDDDHSLLGDILGSGGGKEVEKEGGKVAKKASRWSKMMPKGKGIGSRLLRGGMKVAGGAAKLGLKFGGALLGGGLLSAETLLGGLSLVGSALGMAGTALAAVVSSPVTVPLLLAAGVGAAGYFAYKWLTKPDPQPIEKVRLVQYGFKANDTDAYKKMKSLEQQLAGAVVFKGENAEFDPKKVDLQAAMKIYGLDPSSKSDATKFVAWFANRFRPIYLLHRALIKTSQSPKPLEDVDSNKPDFKKSYLEQCSFPGDHYNIPTNPIKDKDYLPSSKFSVDQQIKIALDEVAKEGTKKEDNKGAAAPAAAGGVAAAAMAKNEADKKKFEEDQKKNNANLTPMQKDPKHDVDKQQAFNRLQAATVGANAAPGGPGRAPGDPVTGPSGPNGQAKPAKSKPGVKPMSGAAELVKQTLLKDMPKYGITSPNQQAALLGNIEHESGFQPISENLNYKPSQLMKLWPNRFPTETQAQQVASQGPQGIANNIYGGRMGNTDANDGWDYRGRGPLQITGKSNYAAVSKAMGKDIVNDPDKLITDPQAAADSALAYWKLNPALGKNADAGNFQKVRQMINGGGIGADDANARVQSYLDKIKNGELSVGGSSSGAGGTVTPTGMVDSPKPSTPNSIDNNPNTGPVPDAYKQAGKATSSTSPAQLVSSPRPSFDSSAGGGSPLTSSSPAPSQNSFVRQNTQLNTGDSMDIMKQGLKESQSQTALLSRIADSMDKLTAALTQGGGAPAAPAAPTEQNNYGKPAAPMTAPSLGFRRTLAGA
uniref:Tail fiber protein n=1 Tax=Burkholderia phage vB_BgluM-SURPRISE13 TaxID=3159457 RepID=A0AAU7PEW1_9VIRU